MWAIIFEKLASLRRANRQANAFEDRSWSGGSLDELYDQEGAKPAHPFAASKNTSLAVVAPGIAEALFTAAIGLVAAIPTVFSLLRAWKLLPARGWRMLTGLGYRAGSPCRKNGA